MNWKEFFKPTIPKIALTILLPIGVSMIFYFFWSLIAGELGRQGLNTLNFGLGLTYSINPCTRIATSGEVDFICAMSRMALWWVVNLIIYYPISSAISYKFKKRKLRGV